MPLVPTKSRWILGLTVAAAVALAIGAGVVPANAATESVAASTSLASTVTTGAKTCFIVRDLRHALNPNAVHTHHAKATHHAKTGTPGVKPSATAHPTTTAHRAHKKHTGTKRVALPTALKTDLKALKADSAAARIVALKAIQTKAAAGGYGATIEAFAVSTAGTSAFTTCEAS